LMHMDDMETHGHISKMTIFNKTKGTGHGI